MTRAAGRVMRLGYDLSIARHPYGGTQRFAMELLSAMNHPAVGWEIVTFAGWPRLPRDPRLRRARRLVNLASDLGWLGPGASWMAARHRLDAWYAPANVVPLALPRPIVVSIHDLNVLVRPDDYDAGYRRFAVRMLRRSTSAADRIIVPSRSVRDGLIGAFGVQPTRVRVVPHGIDHLHRIDAAVDLRIPRPYALYVGQTEPHKNVRLLLDVWRGDVPAGLSLVISGPAGRDDEALRVAAAGPDLRDRVVFTRQLSDAHLAAAYRDASLFLFPSRAEGFGFPPLEAMSYGVPTAVADRGSLPEVTAGGAMLFDPDDAAALASLVRRMHGDEELRGRLARAGRDVAARYRWSATAEAVWEEVRAVSAR